MILDTRNEFCDAVAMNTGGAGTYNIGDVIDTSVARDMGGGHQMYLVVQMTTAATSGGSATAQFQLVSDGSDTISTDGTQTIHAITQAVAVADMTVGKQYVLPLPPEMDIEYERYLAVQQVTAVAAFTAGAVNAFLTFNPPPANKTYADGTN